MNAATQKVIIQILDKTYPIQCTPDQVHDLQMAGYQLNEKMRAIRNEQKQFTIEQVAITAVLNFSYELLQKNQNSSAPAVATTDAELDNLDALLDAALQAEDSAS